MTCNSRKFSRLGIMALASLMLASCGKREEGASRTRSVTPAHPMVRRAPASPRSTFISRDGRSTNAVYKSMKDWSWMRDSDIEELARACDAAPDNADAWYMLGVRIEDSAKQIACFEKAAALAPDALRPKIALAEAYGSAGRIADARVALLAAYELLATPQDVTAWCYASFSANNNGKRGADSLNVYEMVQQHADGSPLDKLALLYLAANNGRHGDALAAAKELLAGSDRDLYRDAVCSALSMLKRTVGTNDAAAQSCSALLAESQPAFNNAMDRIYEARNEQRRGDMSALCADAMRLATNADMRFMATMPLIQQRSSAKGDQVAINLAVEQLINGDRLTASQWSSLLPALMHAGNTGMVARLKDAAMAAMADDPASMASLLRYMSYDSRWYGMDRRYGMDTGITPDFALADSARSRFPSNAAVLRVLADIYGKANYDKDELECRQLLALVTTDAGERMADAAASIARLVKGRMYDEAGAIVGQYGNQASNNAAMATAVYAYLLATGRTNEARAVLIDCCGTMRFAESKAPLLEKLLDTKWSSVADRQSVARFVWSALTPEEWAQRQQRGDIAAKLMRLQADAGMVDEAFACAGNVVRGSGYADWYALLRMPGARDRFPQFVRSLLDSGCTQQTFYATMANACQSSGLDSLALDLVRRGMLVPGEPHERINLFSTGLRLAMAQDDQQALRDLTAAFGDTIRQGGIDPWMLGNISHDMERAGLHDQFTTWAELSWLQSTNKTNPDVAPQLASWLMQCGMTNRLQDLLAQFNGSAASVEHLNMLYTWHRYLGDKAACENDISLMRQALTNATVIGQYGYGFLDMLRNRQQAGFSADGKEARDLVLQWINNPDLPFQLRSSLCYQLQGPKDATVRMEALERLYGEATDGYARSNMRNMLLDAYCNAANTSGFLRIAEEMRRQTGGDSWQIDNLIERYRQFGRTADAILACEEILEKCGDDPTRSCNILQRQARLYLELGDKDEALRCIEASLAAATPENRGDFVSQAADILIAVGQAPKGMALLTEAYNAADNADSANVLAERIMSFAQQTETEFDPRRLVGKLLSFEPSCETYRALATLLERAGDKAAAKNYLNQALGIAQTADDKRMIQERLITIAESPEERLAALDALLLVSDRDNKFYVMQRIGQNLMEAGDARGAIDRMKLYLDQNPGIKSRSGDQLDSIRSMMLQAQIKLGDKAGAWETAQQMGSCDQFMQAARQLGKMEEAVPRLEKELQSGGEYQRLSVARELVNYYQQRRDTAALDALAGTISAMAESAPAGYANSIASLLDSMGRTDDALALLTKASADAEPNMRRSFDEAAVNMLRSKQRYDDALAWLDKRPQDSGTLGLKAQIKAQQGKADEAISLYCDAMATVDPDEQWRRSNYGYQLRDLVARSNDPGVADKVVARLMEGTGAKDPVMLRQAAEIYQAQRKYDEAMDRYQQAASLASGQEKGQFMQEYAACCVNAQKFEKAAGVYSDLLTDKNLRWEDRDRLRMMLAGVYQQSGRESYAFDTYKEAIRDCEEYVRKTPMKEVAFNARLRLADLHHLAKDDNEAVRVLKTMADEYKTGWQAQRVAASLQRYGYKPN